jgi:hypothetical protein
MFKSKLTAPTQVGSRRAQNVSPELANAIRQTCETSPELAGCYLLDMQMPNAPEMNFVIGLALDDEAQQMEVVANRFLEMLKQKFPATADKTFVMPSSQPLFQRFVGFEFYVRTEEPTIVPPVDLNKPVENPNLVVALKEFETKRSEQSQQELFRQLASANFLVAFFPDEMQTTPGSKAGQLTIEKDSLLKIPACADRDGKDHLPLFTDWPAIQAWIDKPVSTLVMPASDAWSFILSQPHYAGAFVNPAGSRLQLSRDLIQYLQGI